MTPASAPLRPPARRDAEPHGRAWYTICVFGALISFEYCEKHLVNVELEYRRRIDAMSAKDRLRRAEALFNWSRDYTARSLLADRGPLTDHQLRLEVALRIYGANLADKALTEELRDRVSR